MFWTNYTLLCAQEGKSPNALAAELGFSSGSVTNWKSGTIPGKSSLKKIADHFGITIWDLLGEKNTATENGDGKETGDEMSDNMKELMRLIPRLTDQEVTILLAQVKGIILGP